MAMGGDDLPSRAVDYRSDIRLHLGSPQFHVLLVQTIVTASYPKFQAVS
jgi:hypothetical protein